MKMDIYQFFSCVTRLPVRIDSIADFLRERGFADHIFFSAVDIDPNILWAQLRVYREPAVYGESVVYEVQYSQHLAPTQQRLACCKELLHVLDQEASMASTQAAVETLIQQMTIPPQLGISLPAVNDHTGIIRALLILMPRDCLVEFKNAYDEGQINSEEVALATGLPVEYARLTLSDVWQELSGMIV